MKLKHYIIILLVFCKGFVYAQADTSHYIYSMFGLNGGYGINLVSPANTKYANPFWTKGGPNISASGLIALRQSYFSVPVVIGYCAPVFDLQDFIGIDLDTTQPSRYQAVSSGNYHIYYAMTGLNVKVPHRTTREAIELRFMVGPLIATQGTISYNYINPLTTPPSPTIISKTFINQSTCTTLAFSPGISLGYKLSKHFAVMGNADLFYALLRFYTTRDNTDDFGNTTSQSLYMRESMLYLQLSAGLTYSIGHIIGNIVN